MKTQVNGLETIGAPTYAGAYCAIAGGELSWDYSQASPSASGQARVKANAHEWNAPSARRVGSGLRTARRSPAMARLSKSRPTADVDEGRGAEVPQRSRDASPPKR